MDLRMDDGTSRFWTAIFGFVSALSVIIGIVYSVNQYRDSKQKDQTNLELQLTIAKFEAQKPFYQRQLELCDQASSAAAILATPKVQAASDLQKAKGDFWKLYWGPLGIVEDAGGVESAMKTFGDCLNGRCAQDIEHLSLDLAHVCRALVAQSWNIVLLNSDASGRNTK